MGLRDFTVYDLCLRNASLFSDREAWIFHDRRVTFRQYLSEINRLAFGLKKRGLKKGDRIAVFAQNSYPFVLLYGAAAKLGAIMLPINWRLTSLEVEYILGDGQPSLLFAGPEYCEMVQKLTASSDLRKNIFSVGDEEKGLPLFSSLLQEEDQIGEEQVGENDPYVIIHTAAVAGRPRGAVLSHGNIVAANLQHIISLGLREEDAYLHLLPLFHIADLALSFAVFHAGGKNVLMPKFDPGVALEIIEAEGITTIGEFPPMLSLLLEKLEGQPRDLSSLTKVLGIDHPANIEKLKKNTRAEFWIGFGQSETSGMVTLCPYSEKPGSAGKEGPLAKIRLVDDYEREAAAGKPGEICVRGPLVFSGYWNLEEDTRYTFREGWHHTGDIGRLDEKGYLWYVKRKAEKELIKPGGENVYPAEVEKTILENPAVKEVAVIGITDPEWGEAVKAICVLKPGTTLSAKELIDFVASRIARYKKPKFVEFVTALPKTKEGGSIDREKVKAEFGK